MSPTFTTNNFPHSAIIEMRGPIRNHLFHNQLVLLSSLHRKGCLIYKSLRLLSTSTSPSLITTRNIPAPHIGHIRILSLNSPHNRNAISRQLLSELSSEITAIQKGVEDERIKGEVVGHGTRALVLASGVDDCFCAGADLKERKIMTLEE